MSTFIKFGAQSISERNAAIRLIFPVGSVWAYKKEPFKVRDHNPHGSIVVDRVADGAPFQLWPHEMKIAEWSRVTKDDQKPSQEEGSRP